MPTVGNPERRVAEGEHRTSPTWARQSGEIDFLNSETGQPPATNYPLGVTQGLASYLQSPAIAEDYDDYFAYNKLFDFDVQIVHQLLDATDHEHELVVDLGCGTGRLLLSVAERGFDCLAVDLSPHMLAVVRAKAEATGLPVQYLRANLVELDCLADGCCGLAVCLFSTLGMISKRRNRVQCLRHIRRILRPGGRFVLHVHNYWYSLHDKGGPWWFVRNLAHSLVLGDVERGDKFFVYRGVPDMYLHVFRGHELRVALRETGFCIRDWIPLSASRDERLRWPLLFGDFRANGWIVVCDVGSQ